MGTDTDNPISQARQGVNWLVGLSGGAVGGALLKLDWILKFPAGAKWVFVATTVCFLLSIFFGVFYAFELFALAQRKESLSRLSDSTPKGSEEETGKAKEKVESAAAKVRRFHHSTFASFAAASVLSIVVLLLVLFRCPACDAPPPPLAAIYAITSTPVDFDGQSARTHTFLLNQQTGQVWEMRCNGGSVEFRQVLRTPYNGSVEKPLNSGPAQKEK